MGAHKSGIPLGAELDLWLRKLTDEELATTKADLEEDIGMIKSQIQEARARAASSGDYSDADWYRRANGAQRVKAVQFNACCREQGRRRRETANRNRASLGNNPWESAFCKAARELLKPETFESLSRRAHEIVEDRRALMMAVELGGQDVGT